MATSIKKILVGCAATALLASPLSAFAGPLADGLNGFASDLLRQKYPNSNAVVAGMQNAARAAGAYEKSKPQNLDQLVKQRDALVRALRQLRSAIASVQKSNLTDAEKAELRSAAEQAIALLQAEIDKLDAAIIAEQEKAQRSSTSAAKPGTSVPPPLPITPGEKVINVLQFNVAMGKNPKGQSFVKYTTTVHEAEPRTLQFPLRILFSEMVNGNEKPITTVTATKNHCKANAKTKLTTCTVNLPATAARTKTATRNVTAKMVTAKNKVIATLDVRGGNLFSGPTMAPTQQDSSSRDALLKREQEAMALILQRLAQLRARAEEKGMIYEDWKFIAVEIQKLLDKAVLASKVGERSLEREEALLREVLAGLQKLGEERRRSSVIGGGHDTLIIQDLFSLRLEYESLLALIDDKLKIIADLRAVSAAVSTAPTPSQPASQPRAPSPDQSSAPTSARETSSPDSTAQSTAVSQKTCRGDQLYQEGRPLGRFVCDPIGALVYCSNETVTHTAGPVTDPRHPFCDPRVPDRIHYCAQSGDQYILQTFTDSSAGCPAPAASSQQ